jgi:hypothetical protein
MGAFHDGVRYLHASLMMTDILAAAHSLDLTGRQRFSPGLRVIIWVTVMVS